MQDDYVYMQENHVLIMFNQFCIYVQLSMYAWIINYVCLQDKYIYIYI